MDQRIQVCEAMDEAWPGVGNQREEEACAASCEEAIAGLVELFRGELILLEVYSGEAIDLEVKQGGGDNGQELGVAGLQGVDRSEASVLMVEFDGVSRLVVASCESLDWGFHGGEGRFIWGAASTFENWGLGGFGFARPLERGIVVCGSPDLPGWIQMMLG